MRHPRLISVAPSFSSMPWTRWLSVSVTNLSEGGLCVSCKCRYVAELLDKNVVIGTSDPAQLKSSVIIQNYTIGSMLYSVGSKIFHSLCVTWHMKKRSILESSYLMCHTGHWTKIEGAAKNFEQVTLSQAKALLSCLQSKAVTLHKASDIERPRHQQKGIGTRRGEARESNHSTIVRTDKTDDPSLLA